MANGDTQQTGPAGEPTTPTQPAASAPSGWAMPEKFAGKSSEDIARAYTELEHKLGRVPELEKQIQQWQEFGQTWDPHLRQLGYSPQRMHQMLSQTAESQGASPAKADQMASKAMKRWAELADPYEQETYLSSMLQGAVNPLRQEVQQSMQQLSQAGTDYMHRLVDYTIRALEKKIENPKVSIQELLSEAVKLSSSPMDPIEAAYQRRMAPSRDEERARMRTELLAEIEADQKNKSLTTFVSAGGPSSKRALTPSASPQGTPTPQPAPRSTGFGMPPQGMETARERFLRDFKEKIEPGPF